MGYLGNGSTSTEPELDGALARAIRQLIAEAVDTGGTGDTAPDEDTAAAYR
jgi:hypothetical protein